MRPTLPPRRRSALLTATFAFSALGASAQALSPDYLAYIETFAPLAVQEMYSAGIPASITLAQGLLESGAGKSTLATQANNHFGIKCHGSWEGDRHYRKDDDRNRHGVLVESCFRSYGHVHDSYADHSEFLKSSPRYASLFTLRKTDYKGWARGLKKAGYATAGTYATHLIDIIERYDLHTYDLAEQTGVLAAAPVLTDEVVFEAEPGRAVAVSSVIEPHNELPSTARRVAAGSVRSKNDVDYTRPLPGESVADIARRTRSYSTDIIRYNEGLTHSTQSPAADAVVYLQPKRKSHRGRNRQHRVRDAETMQSIADKYGVRTASLYSRNRMEENTQPATGEVIYLRGRRKRKNRIRLRSRNARRSEIATSTPSEVAAPASSTASASTEPSRPAQRPKVETITPPPVAASAQVPTAAAEPTYITVGSGDTLWGISRKTGVSVVDLQRLNALDGNTIHPGQRLNVQ